MCIRIYIVFSYKIELKTKKWKHALILYMVGADPTIAAQERCIAINWNYIAKLKVYYHNDEYFLMLNTKPIIMKAWTPDFDFNKKLIQMFHYGLSYQSYQIYF